jgi:hypothetical protein
VAGQSALPLREDRAAANGEGPCDGVCESAAISRRNSSLDFGEGVQLLCHVSVLRLCEIHGTELQKGDQHETLPSQMLIEGEAPQVRVDHLTGFAFIQGVIMLEPA